METVFLAMSGGIDSSFAAYLLKEQGYNVVGFTFALLPPGMKSSRNPKACCAAESVARARQAASTLGIPHYVLNMRDEFQSFVIDRFIGEYRKGRTPNPCVLCNRHIKFGTFLRQARSLGAERIATGHYAVVRPCAATGHVLAKGADGAKDQSYFLYPVRREDLPAVIFPLSRWKKSDVLTRAPTVVPVTARTRESQDVCFIPGNYRDFLAGFVERQRGPLLLVDGTHLGFHEGIHSFTIGQRKGINVPFKEALYVVSLDIEANTVVVGSRECLARTTLIAEDVNFLAGAKVGRATAKIRYRAPEEACTYRYRDDVLEVTFDRPVFAVAPGQSVVLYAGETVIAGGTIRESR